MSYPFPPDLLRLVNERMALGNYESEDALLVDALTALEDIERRADELREEIGRRVATAGGPSSQPLDRDAFKREVRSEQGRD